MKATSPYLRSIPVPGDFMPFPRSATEGSIVERFDEMALRHGGKVAVCDHAGELSYDGLKTRVRATASMLVRCLGGSESGRGVGLIFEPGVESVVGIMGVLASGHFFCPLSAQDPPLRLRRYLDDAEIEVIVSTRGGVSSSVLRELGSCRVVYIEDVMDAEAEDNAPLRIEPERMAAVLYTSGSTGVPKGVIHTHRSLLHMVMDKGNEFGLSASDRVGGLSTFTFGGYYWNVLAALLYGATLHLYDFYRHRFDALGDWLINRRISYFHCTPTTLRQFLDALKAPTCFPSLRLVSLGGETVYPRDVHCFQHLVDNAVHLGTTGATIETYYYSSAFFRRPFPSEVDRLPMGFPSPEARVEIRDESGAVVPAGRTGEITVSSDSVSPGYWKRPELNAEKFEVIGGQRYFRLGDLGTFTAEGLLYHQGRMDFQIKIRGIRVELGEIETVLYKHPDVRQAVVTGHAGGDGEMILVAYVTTVDGGPIDLDELYELLGRHLSPHQLPARVMFLESFPLTRTHKIDRAALPDPDTIGREEPGSVLPRTDVERRIHGIWGEVLGHTAFGVTHPFVSIGGDSLRAMRVLNRMEEEFQASLPMGDFMASGTVETLAHLLQQRTRR